MIRLLIDNKEAVIEADSGIDIIRKNPFFTKEGDLTYDISLDLKNPQNAKLFGYLNRFQILNQPTGRTAALFDGPRCLIRGTEIVLSIDDSVVKIQIVGTNSELNYLTGFDMSIRDYDYGPVANPGILNPEEEIYDETFNGRFPNKYYNYSPLIIRKSDGTFNNANIFKYGLDGKLYLVEGVRAIKQPFFLFFVEKIIELIGYKITKNELRDDALFAGLQIITTKQWSEWREVLPDWTVDQFITEVETFCNCIFIVDQYNKEIAIRSIKGFYDSAEIVYLDNVMDNRAVEFSEEPEELFLNYSSVKYDFPDNDLYRYACLDSNIIEKCTNTYFTEMGGLDSVNLESKYNTFELFHVENKGLSFVIDKDNGGFYWKQVNNLAAKGNSKDVVTLKMYPAVTSTYKSSQIIGINLEALVDSMAPIVYDTTEKTDEQGLNEAIQSGLQEDDTPDGLMLSCYMGYLPTYRLLENGQYVTTIVTLPSSVSYPIFAINKYVFDVSLFMPYSLELQGKYGMYSRLYSGNVNIDTKKKVTIHFLTTEILDPKLIYQFRNKRYYCAQLKYSVENGELGKMVEGEFYPIEK